MRHCGNVLMCGVYCGVKWPGVAQRASSPFFGALLPPGMAVRGKQGLVGTPEPPTNVQPPINNVPPCLKLHYGPTQGPVHVVIMTTLLQPAYITSDQIGHSASRPTESRTGGGGGWLMCALPGCLADADHPAQAQSSSNNLRCCGTGLLPGTAGGDAGMPACSPPCWCGLTAAACPPGSCSWASPLAAAGGGGGAPAAGVTAGGWSGSAELGIGAGGGCCTVAGAGGGCCTVAGAGGGCCTVAGAGGGCCTAAGAGGGCCTAAAGAAAGGCSRRVLGAAGEGGCSLG